MVVKFNRAKSGGNSAVVTILIFIGGFGLIFITLASINSFLSGQEKKYLSRTLETTEGVLIGAGKRMAFTSMQTSIAFPGNSSSIYIYYRYSVKGKKYTQGTKSTKIENNVLRSMIKNKVPVRVKYSIVKPQVSKLELSNL